MSDSTLDVSLEGEIESHSGTYMLKLKKLKWFSCIQQNVRLSLCETTQVRQHMQCKTLETATTAILCKWHVLEMCTGCVLFGISAFENKTSWFVFLNCACMRSRVKSVLTMLSMHRVTVCTKCRLTTLLVNILCQYSVLKWQRFEQHWNTHSGSFLFLFTSNF